jgi:hypothetical protein
MNAQDKGLKSPSNYCGYRPLYKDTLYINFGSGNKMEVIYRWFDLFHDDEDAYNKYFWEPFNAKLSLLQKQVKELSMDDDNKYVITLKTEKMHENAIMNAMHYRNMDEIRQIMEERKDSFDTAIERFFGGEVKKRSILTVKKRKVPEDTNEYLLHGTELIGMAQWQHIVEIKDVSWKVRFYLSDLSDLDVFSEVDLSAFFRSEKANFLRRRLYRFHTCLNYRLVDGEIKYEHQYGEIKRKRTKHMALRWSPTLGTSLVKGKWSTDLGALIGFSFNDKQEAALRLALRYQLKGIGSDSGHRLYYNGFVDSMMDVNIGKDYEREQWVGVGLGYLAHQEGDIFGKNTARVFMKYRSKNMWGIQPEFNYSFDDNKGFVGIGFFLSL